jgi:hypothetical protein
MSAISTAAIAANIPNKLDKLFSVASVPSKESKTTSKCQSKKTFFLMRPTH